MVYMNPNMVTTYCEIIYVKIKNFQACIERQIMADLPPERLDWHHPPFYKVGLDFFGPFNVVYGRGNVKIYGCIFTCMSSRAIHLEMLHSLNADAFMNSLRRFIAKIFSDNGTNIVCCCKEVKSCISRSQDALQHKCF